MTDCTIKEKEILLDLTSAHDFMAILDPNAERFLIQNIHDKKKTVMTPCQIKRASLTSLIPPAESGYGTFITINEIPTGSSRKSADVTRVRAVSADDDIPRVGERTDWALVPSLVVYTSQGKFQYHWLVEGEMDVNVAEAVKKSIAQTYNTDRGGVSGASRVMRLPGFPHQKDKPYLVKYRGGRTTYTSEQLVEAFGTETINVPSKGVMIGEDKVGATVLDCFASSGDLLSRFADGHLVNCPWSDTHSNPNDKTAKLLLAGTGGYSHWTFYCHHDHCIERKNNAIIRHFDINVEDIDYEYAYGLIEGITGGIQLFADTKPPEVKTKEPRKIPTDVSVPSISEMYSSFTEFETAKLAPREIVENYLYADTAIMVAPGGVGKTTQILLELINISLGRPVWGHQTTNPGICIFITAEDNREMCLGRMYRLMVALGLSRKEIDHVSKNVLIWDVSGQQVKLVRTEKDIVLTDLADKIVTAYYGNNIAKIVFDPLVSFGASENAVNDNEQAIITATRWLKEGLECNVRAIHHTGQMVAREKIMDQYAGRGGTALSDGARMVSVLMKWEPGGKYMPPIALHEKWAREKRSIVLMNQAKLSYAMVENPLTWIARDGYNYEYAEHVEETTSEMSERHQEDMILFLKSELGAAHYHSKRDLEDTKLYEDISSGMSRNIFRKTLKMLMDEGKVINGELPEGLKQGSRKTYLHAI